MNIKPSKHQGGVVVELRPEEQEIPGTRSETYSSPAPVFKIKQILVPIDFSACSRKALRYAVPFANQFGARLCLLYVGQDYYLVPECAPLDVSSIDSKARADAAGKLAELATQEINEKVPTDLLVRSGHPPTEIVNVAKETKADLIIISTHGYTGLKHACFGSMAENVVRHAPCPVFVVREEEHEFLVEGAEGN